MTTMTTPPNKDSASAKCVPDDTIIIIEMRRKDDRMYSIVFIIAISLQLKRARARARPHTLAIHYCFVIRFSLGYEIIIIFHKIAFAVRWRDGTEVWLNSFVYIHSYELCVYSERFCGCLSPLYAACVAVDPAEAFAYAPSGVRVEFHISV